MSIRTRVEDAELFWVLGRVEGAWLQALIAAAATARKRYPKPKKDNEAFKLFICDIASTIISGQVGLPGPVYYRFYTQDRGTHRRLEDILYTELRCNLVHEGKLKDVGFSKSTIKNMKSEAIMNVPSTGAAVIPDFWVLHLLAAIKNAPENKMLWP